MQEVAQDWMFKRNLETSSKIHFERPVWYHVVRKGLFDWLTTVKLDDFRVLSGTSNDFSCMLQKQRYENFSREQEVNMNIVTEPLRNSQETLDTQKSKSGDFKKLSFLAQILGFL